MSDWTPLSALLDKCNDTDTLHALVPTERDGDDLYVLTVREQPAKKGEGEVLHIRTALVDLLDQRVEWTPNGMVLPFTENLPLGLGKSLVATYNTRGQDTEPLIRNGLNGGDDSLAETLLGVDETDTEQSQSTSTSTTSTASTSSTSEEPLGEGMVECVKCEAVIEEAEATLFSSGPPLGEVWVCKGGCSDE